jgi:hypothetical protein
VRDSRRAKKKAPTDAALTMPAALAIRIYEKIIMYNDVVFPDIPSVFAMHCGERTVYSATNFAGTTARRFTKVMLVGTAPEP